MLITDFILFWCPCCCHRSVIKSYPALCDPVDFSTPGFPVLHCLPEFARTHVYWAGDAIQPCHPLSPLSPAFNLSQHQGFFQWASSSHQVAKVWELQLHAMWSILPMSIQGWLPLKLTGLISLLSKGASRLFSHTTVRKHKFLST